MSDCLYIVMPAYNEALNIRATVRDWHRQLRLVDCSPDSRLLVIDDGSTDNTGSILDQLTAKYPQLLVRHQANSGHGATLMTAYHEALDKGADYVFQTDSDGQTDAAQFADFWSLREDAPLVIGKRSQRQDGRARLFVSLVLRFVIQLTLGVNLKDANTPYRLMHGPTFSSWLESMPEGFFLSNALLTATAAWTGSKILWLPISFKPRQGGKNSINPRRICRVGFRSISAFRQARRRLEAVHGPRIT